MCTPKDSWCLKYLSGSWVCSHGSQIRDLEQLREADWFKEDVCHTEGTHATKRGTGTQLHDFSETEQKLHEHYLTPSYPPPTLWAYMGSQSVTHSVT